MKKDGRRASSHSRHNVWMKRSALTLVRGVDDRVLHVLRPQTARQRGKAVVVVCRVGGDPDGLHTPGPA